jgi:hypothetical protein
MSTSSNRPKLATMYERLNRNGAFGLSIVVCFQALMSKMPLSDKRFGEFDETKLDPGTIAIMEVWMASILFRMSSHNQHLRVCADICRVQRDAKDPQIQAAWEAFQTRLHEDPETKPAPGPPVRVDSQSRCLLLLTVPCSLTRSCSGQVSALLPVSSRLSIGD